jgi:hypothetical protein
MPTAKPQWRSISRDLDVCAGAEVAACGMAVDAISHPRLKANVTACP